MGETIDSAIHSIAHFATAAAARSPMLWRGTQHAASRFP
jgi:hypothetical protein